MIGITADFLFAYILGGITFLPTCLLLFVAFTNKVVSNRSVRTVEDSAISDQLQRPDDDAESFESLGGAESLLKQFHSEHEPDVAAGYFAVCREYVPGGVNGKPPERVTPAGTVVTSDSPSVYQSMYRSIFERKQSSTIDHGRADGKTIRRARNVFYVILRHGHLMLYEDSEQLEVKYVISLESYDVSIYGGGDQIPEGELWIKKNAIQLCKRSSKGEGETKPFFLFSENCSDKEDFYFALLRNQEINADVLRNPPRSLQHESQHIIGLVQKLHSSEDQLHTRWINGLVGRLFLALYKTVEVQDFLREKITKKIARVQKPAFLSGIVLQKIDVGDSAPQITNPRLKDLTIDGDCCVEADVHYNGNFRLEIAATARLDLGTRFKAREVNIVLAVVVKKLSGHGLLKFKPPPSNRTWIAFERMPDMELLIEPIVSSRQITFGVILRAIQSRIREVVAETLVVPHWDDIPFTDTRAQDFRGGIWADSKPQKSSPPTPVTIPDEAPSSNARDDINGSSLLCVDTHDASDVQTTTPSLTDPWDHEQSSEQLEVSNDAELPPPSTKADTPRQIHRSLSSTSMAMTKTDGLRLDMAAPGLSRNSEDPPHKRAAKHTVSEQLKSIPTTTASVLAVDTVPSTRNGTSWDSHGDALRDACDGSEGSINDASAVSAIPGSTKPLTKRQIYAQSSHSPIPPSSEKVQLNSGNKSMAAIGAATAVAKKWGWGVLNRNLERNNGASSPKPIPAGSPANPIGRGQPIPQQNQQTPTLAAQRSTSMPLSVHKKRPQAIQRSDYDLRTLSSDLQSPGRRKSAALTDSHQDEERLLVVHAPTEEMNVTTLQPWETQADSGSETKIDKNVEHIVEVDLSEHQMPASVPSPDQKQFKIA